MPEAENKIKIVCPKCATKQYVDTSKAFSKVDCESCQVRFTVPKVFGNIMLHDLVSNDEFSSSHTGTHLKEGHNSRVRIFNKRLFENETAIKTLKDQIYKIKESKSEACLEILSYGFIGKEFYIEYESSDKGSLKSRMMTEKVSQKAALEFSISTGESLMQLHQKNIIVGNMKTSNLRCLKNRKIKLADCGITWITASILSETDPDIQTFNNLPYIAPETVNKKIVNKASDIYNFGCVVYELISKVTPFEEYSSRQAIMNAHCEKEPLDLLKRKPALPPDIAKMVMRMLAKNPLDRPSDIKIIVDCFKSNLDEVEEFQVEEIKREFDNPSPDQTLKPRPPTEIDLNLLSGNSLASASASDTLSSKNTITDSIKDPEEEQDLMLKSDLDKLLDGDKVESNSEVKLQDTEVNMDDFDDIDPEHVGEKGSKAMLYAILVFIVIIIIGIIYVIVSGMSNAGGAREKLEVIKFINNYF